MYNLESFCGELWSQIEITALGEYKICCLANFNADYGLAHDKNGHVMNVLTHSIQEAINSETHKTHRKELRENIQVTRCRTCYDIERSTKGNFSWNGENEKKWGISKRQRVLWVTSKQIPEYVNWNNADQYTLDDGTSTAKVVNLAIRFGNLCNQKCIMCSPEFSSLWYDDWVALYGYNHSAMHQGVTNEKFKIEIKEHGKNTLNFAKWWESDIWWERFDEVAHNLQHVYISGGEPLIAPASDKMLDILIERGYAKNITIRFDTNLSVINDKIIDRFKHFKKVNLCISVDDVEDRYELIRFPGKFQTLVDNIQKLKNRGIEIHCLYCCIGIASIYSVPRLIEFAEKLNISPVFRFIEGPFWLDLRSLPKSAKQEIIATYESFSAHSAPRQKWYRAVIVFLQKYIDEENSERINEFVDTMNKMDQLRNINWRETLPDIYDLLKRHCSAQ